MKIPFRDFDPSNFSFHDHPVLVLEDFWSAEDMARFRSAMERCHWTRLSEIPQTHSTFPNCGDWLMAELADPERDELVRRALMPCVDSYMRTFSDVKRGITVFNYFAYGVGDCLTLHADTDSDDPDDASRVFIRRRIALATYLHEQWRPDWGGEFVAYREKGNDPQDRKLEVSHWIPPEPGQLTLFTVPRHHRVCRVDPLAGPHKRLSIAGWFMTEHFSAQE